MKHTREREMHKKILSQNLKRQYHLLGLFINGEIRTGLGEGPMASSCECGNEPS
jgi:hypothetical protein